MNNFSLKSKLDDEQLNKKCILIIGILYFIILFWVIIFKCNVNSALHVEVNRSKPLLDRFISGCTKNPIKALQWAIKRKYYIEVLAFVFNIIALIPLGVFFRYFYKRGKSLALSFLVILFVELFQLFSGYGGFELTDFATNMTGALIGVILFEKLVLVVKPKHINNTIRFAIYPAFAFSIFAIVNTIIHFPG